MQGFLTFFFLLSFFCCKAQALGAGDSVVAAHGLGSCSSRAQYLLSMGFAPLQHTESSRTRDQTCVPCNWQGRFLSIAPPGKSGCSSLSMTWASLMAYLVKNVPAMWETWVQSLGWEDPLERERLPTPVFWPGQFHRLYSPCTRKELDMTERLSLSLFSIHKSW